MDNYPKKAKVVHCGKPQNDRFNTKFNQIYSIIAKFLNFLNSEIPGQTQLSVCPLLRYTGLEFSQKSGFNGSTGVIGYTDSEYKIVNNIFQIFAVKSIINSSDCINEC